MSMRSCYSSSPFLRGISRAAWRHAVAGTPSLSGSHNLCHLPLRPRVPPIALGLAGRFFSSSSSKSKRSTKKSAAKKDTPTGSAGGGQFYVVRKGDVIGIYKDLADCQAQVSNSVCDPSATVYKGCSLRKETEEYLAKRGLKNALYSINAADARDELFDALAPCPFQQPDGIASSALETGPSKKHPKVAEQEPLPDSHLSCILEFDGACKGNPGKSGAGVIIRRPDGSVIAHLREGLGIATCNAAEYHALLLGLRYAANKGFKYVRAQGDSKLVCNQVQDLWRVRNDNMADLCKKAKELKGKFLQFQINHALRKFNADADAQANFAVELPVGEVQEQTNFPC
ncbi:uncharacterized protein LOC119297892 [Triticum dicoccoides]|uniref:RNase H type-1 domain-containing protein n=1 Tax=Triticum turgidum subsp. durum TaxID=4567 RepID=A0A9R0WR58_TRITD|nr:uncharacterized protein LOC119297892 [Triticum dicoccoides]XP_044385570.1 uncharacterized protein LOC123107684 [Triticum aestivum]VAI20971.1 unnamed protein product [Triticum turgidum subsp. durum]